MKFDQLIEYNMRNIFLAKSYNTCGGETFPRSFSKKSKFSMSLDQCSKVLHSFFIVCLVEDYWNILKLSYKPLAFTSPKAFQKNKKRSVTSFSASFFARFLKKNISLVILFHVTKFHFMVVFTWWDIGQ